MHNRLGAILCLLLGSVLIWSGLSASSSGSIGTTSFCQGNIGTTTPCPTGTINFAEVTDLSAAPGTTPPSTWTVRVTSPNCSSPSDSAVDEVVTVNNNDNASTGDLFVWGDATHSITCEYAYTEDPVAGYTTTYNPIPPHALTFGGGQSNSGLKVTVTNAADALPTKTKTPTKTPTKTATPSKSPTHSSSSSKAPTAVTSAPAGSSSAPTLASTGPRHSVGTSVGVGIGLCALGLVLLFAGRRPKPARHRDAR